MICKLEDMYFIWSGVVDAPTTFGGSIEELKAWVRERYGLQGMEELPERLARVERKGTSSMRDSSVDDVVRFNRAGRGETQLPKRDLISYLRGWTDPSPWGLKQPDPNFGELLDGCSKRAVVDAWREDIGSAVFDGTIPSAIEAQDSDTTKLYFVPGTDVQVSVDRLYGVYSVGRYGVIDTGLLGNLGQRFGWCGVDATTIRRVAEAVQEIEGVET